LRDPL